MVTGDCGISPEALEPVQPTVKTRSPHCYHHIPENANTADFPETVAQQNWGRLCDNRESRQGDKTHTTLHGHFVRMPNKPGTD